MSDTQLNFTETSKNTKSFINKLSHNSDINSNEFLDLINKLSCKINVYMCFHICYKGMPISKDCTVHSTDVNMVQSSLTIFNFILLPSI